MLFCNILDAADGTKVENATFTLILNGKDTIKYNVLNTQNFGAEEAWNTLLEIPFRKGNYTLSVNKEGYRETSKSFKVQHDGMSYVGLVSMLKDVRHRRLGEVVVKATRVKMVMHGDTVVYDAGAFELPEGSMLDALVAQLPGATLKDGQIRVNGKLIENIIVNGEDFFKGNPKVALENLPAYIVKHIKVYDRAEGADYLGRKATGGKRMPGQAEHLVMDVRLKKDYNQGWIANAEGGYSPSTQHYLGKLFGLGYSDRLRLAFFSNLNNISNTDINSQSGYWGSGWQQDGVMQLKTAGLSYLYTPGKYKFSGKVMLSGEQPFVEQKLSSTLYFKENDLFQRTLMRNNEDKLHLITSHGVERQRESSYFNAQILLDHMKNDNTALHRSATFTHAPQETYRLQSLDSLFSPLGARTSYAQQLLQRYQQEKDNTTQWTIVRASSMLALHSADMRHDANFHINGEYRNDQNNSLISTHRAYGTQSNQKGSGENLAQRQTYDFYSYTINASADWKRTFLPKTLTHGFLYQLQPRLEYQRYYNNKDNDFWQLREQLTPSTWNNILPPSAIDPQKLSADLNNTIHSIYAKDAVIPKIETTIAYYLDFQTNSYIALNLQMGNALHHENINYHRHALDTTVSRWNGAWQNGAAIEYQHNTQKVNTTYSLQYALQESVPSILYQLGTTEDSDPTNIFINRPGLRKALAHKAEANFNWVWNKTHRSLSLNANYNLTQRAIAMARSYDRNTGVNTWTPTNIDGNWNTATSLQFATPFGKNEAFQLQTNTAAYYVNSVDFTTDRSIPEESVVRHLTLSQSATLAYRIHKHSFALSAQASWLNSHANLNSFTPISALDLNTKAQALVQLPKGFQLSTDLTLYARRGYNDPMLNTTNWVWNAALSKSLFREKLTLKISAIDLLNEISTVTHALNAQGRTETWTNAVPHYVMFSAIYRLHIMPKKK